VTRYVDERRDTFGVEPICRTLGVPVSTHYARRSRKPSRRELADRELLVEIEAARSGRWRVYGARKTWKELRRRDVDVQTDQATLTDARAGTGSLDAKARRSVRGTIDVSGGTGCKCRPSGQARRSCFAVSQVV
jgi:hypothetical protein